MATTKRRGWRAPAKFVAAAFGVAAIALSTPIGSVLGARPGGEARRPTSPPSGATMQCKDGTYSFVVSRNGACWGHGGVARVLSSRVSPLPAPAPPARRPAVKPVPKKPAPRSTSAKR